jgi:hypothetical protein
MVIGPLPAQRAGAGGSSAAVWSTLLPLLLLARAASGALAEATTSAPSASTVDLSGATSAPTKAVGGGGGAAAAASAPVTGDDVEKAVQATFIWGMLLMCCVGGPICFLIPQLFRDPMKTLRWGVGHLVHCMRCRHCKDAEGNGGRGGEGAAGMSGARARARASTFFARTWTRSRTIAREMVRGHLSRFGSSTARIGFYLVVVTRGGRQDGEPARS